LLSYVPLMTVTSLIGKEEIGSPLDLLNFTLPESGQIRHELAKGANMIIDLMKEVEEDLPVFRLVPVDRSLYKLLSQTDTRFQSCV
jgi:hypothetical protein